MADKDLFPVMPIVGRVGHQLENLIFRPVAVEEGAFEDGYNPFPNKSLCISFRKPEQKGRNKKQKKRFTILERVEMDQFLINHGHLLTSLALHKTAVTPAQLVQILPSLSNLKALTLHQIEIGCSAEEAKKFLEENPIVKGNALPSLTHLRVFFCDLAVIQWLVNAPAAGLVRLELDGKEILPFSQEDFGKLEQLTVTKANENFLNHSETLPLLKCLSLIDLHRETEPENSYILNFIKSFQQLWRFSISVLILSWITIATVRSRKKTRQDHLSESETVVCASSRAL